MSGINSAMFRDDFGEFHEFFGGSERTRRIDQSTGHAEGTVSHALPDKFTHFV
jgi:hypothetical protein